MNAVEKIKDTKEPKGEVQLAVFLLGEEEYALDIMEIMEIIRAQKITDLPESSEFIEGVVNLRGKVIPIIDLRGRLNKPINRVETDKEGTNGRIIIINRNGKIVGLQVDMVTEVIRLPMKEIDPLPEDIGKGGSQYLSGIAKCGEKLILVLNIDRIMGL